MRLRAATIALVSVTALSHASPVAAQRRPGYFETPAAIRIVGTPAPGERVPLVVALPPTGAPARWLFDELATYIPFRAYVILLPAGAPSRADYADFDRFAQWFDARLAIDLTRARSQFSIDPARTYVMGFSLGGDLAWALLARHPNDYRGAIVIGSRCGTSMSRASLAALRTRGTHITLAIGTHDLSERVQGLLAAYRRVEREHIASTLVRFEAEHDIPRTAAEAREVFRGFER